MANNISKSVLKKISVAPNFFIYHEYFNQLCKFFKQYKDKEFSIIEKECDEECMNRIESGKFPMGEKEEKKIKSFCKGLGIKSPF
ncbi:hypothetical protein KKA27_01785 [Patescibacteria group bacterium]|nr:hypothetical protein [Patescibacteria group bacterium]MBU2632970.1 hypothetical protein [Patescibacteria group bacterium]